MTNFPLNLVGERIVDHYFTIQSYMTIPVR